MSCFVDTSAFYALMDAADQDHARSKARWTRLVDEDEAMVTTNYVLLETAALLQNRLGLEAVRVFQDDVAALCSIQWVDEGLHKSAVSGLLLSGNRKISLVDAVSFQVMREAGVDKAFCFDQHFRKQGFTVLS